MIARLTTIAVLVASCAAASLPAQAGGVYVNIAPPAPRYEVVPGPRAGYFWTPGFWDWRRGRYVWVGGVWGRERPGYVYRPHAWVQEGGRWRHDGGSWARGGDRDHDGVPNRFDRRPNDPYRR